MGTLAIIGGQYGSEGKGVIAHRFSREVSVAIRVGGSNAGHSIIHEGRVWKMRMIPVAWTNPECLLVLGPGAVIDPPVLFDEIAQLEEAGYKIRDRLMIDQRATIMDPGDATTETISTDLVRRIGSTGKGIGAARARRLNRNEKDWITAAQAFPDLAVCDTTRHYRTLAESPGDAHVMIEGTQGYGLSLTHGPWPFVTSADLTAAALLNDCQLAPSVPYVVGMVLRAFPIRVAGNSGPMYQERTWEQLNREPETTTVTGKIRRVGLFDWELAREAVRVNRPDWIALTFADYIDETVTGATRWEQLTDPVFRFISDLEDTLNVPVALIGTGGPEWSVVLRPAHQVVFGGGARIR